MIRIWQRSGPIVEVEARWGATVKVRPIKKLRLQRTLPTPHRYWMVVLNIERVRPTPWTLNGPDATEEATLAPVSLPVSDILRHPVFLPVWYPVPVRWILFTKISSHVNYIYYTLQNNSEKIAGHVSFFFEKKNYFKIYTYHIWKAGNKGQRGLMMGSAPSILQGDKQDLMEICLQLKACLIMRGRWFWTLFLSF